MTLYIQHGHGKADKIDKALQAGSIDGVIFGARNERRGNLESYINTLRENYDTKLLFDPQFYVSTFNPPNERYLPEYEYFQPGRTATDFVGARRLSEYASQTLKPQFDLGLDYLISPSVLSETFVDR